MLRKNINLLMLIVVVLLNSCTGSEKKVDSSDAEPVNIIKNNETVTYNNIKDGSFLDWRATHLGGIEERLGKIHFKEASVLVNAGKLTNAVFLIDMNTLVVENLPENDAEELTMHLKDFDFFDIEKHPVSKFELTNMEAINGAFNSKVTGNLTILGLSKSIAFNANIKVDNNTVSIKSETFAINREDWGLTYHAEGAKGVPLNYLISNEIEFQINVTLTL